ncbi:hypothetical protein EV424DRAFT_1542243 [Suillus variegatus]|nr:hypothetical protein EV424DRAFT_1542243 [Suillus variegatus]
MSSAMNSVAPQGAGGKDVSHLNPDHNGDMSDDEVDDLANALGQVQRVIDFDDQEAVIAENLCRSKHNLLRAKQRANPDYVEVPDDDEPYLEEPITPPVIPAPTSSLAKRLAKAYGYIGSLTPTTRKLVHTISGVDEPPPTVPDLHASSVAPSTSSSISNDAYTFTQSNTRVTSSLKSTYKIPCPILNLAKAKIHVPLTVLTPMALWKIHQDPSCIKMTKGLVLDDPKLSVMDATSSGFPPESSLPADQFNEAFSNFIKLMRQVADSSIVQRIIDHCAFCMERDDFSENYRTILAFDIKTH